LKEQVLKELSVAYFPFNIFFSDAAPTFQYAFIDQTVQPGEFLNNFQTERQKDRQTERPKDRKTERQKDRKTEQFCLIFFPNVFISY
jgi:hypothetical protein